MKYADDWVKIQERFKAFWANDIVDRCCVKVTAPRENTKYKVFDRSDLRKFWMDPQCVLERHEDFFEKTFFGGEAFPKIWVNPGPGITSAYLGCEVNFSENTIWFKPFINDWETDTFEFNSESEWWITTKELTRELCAMSKGNFLVSITDLSGAADIMCHMRGTGELCMDLVEKPDEAKKARDSIMDVLYRCYDELYNITYENCQGSTHWLNLWAPGKHLILQCDFSTMISPRMFEEFFLPEIQNHCKFFEYPIYHLDGPDEIKHLDMLLEIKELKAIQWVPTPGQGDPRMWMPMFKKIQTAGKSLYFELNPWCGSSYKDIEYVLQELSPKGLFLDTSCETEEEARWLLKNLGKWSCRT